MVAVEEEQPEHLVGVSGGVGHELARVQTCLLVEEPIEDEEAVAEGTGDGDAVEACEGVVAGEVDVFPARG